MTDLFDTIPLAAAVERGMQPVLPGRHAASGGPAPFPQYILRADDPNSFISHRCCVCGGAVASRGIRDAATSRWACAGHVENARAYRAGVT